VVPRRIAVTVLSAGLLLAVGAAPANAAPANAAGDTPPRVTNGPCQYTETTDEPAARPVPLPRDPRHTPNRGTVTVTLFTNVGLIPLTLDRAQAPCTVQSFLHLTRHGFYNRTICHRLTTYPTLKVLQCGDPSGTGSGGPTYQFPTQVTGSETYARGTVAMANSGQGFDGSQFFLVYGDSQLPPNYTVVGTVDDAGLQVLDTIAANGNNGANGAGDGVPNQPVTITSMTVGS